MKNDLKKEIRSQKNSFMSVEDDFLAKAKLVSDEVFPDKNLLTRILDNIELENVTKSDVVRNNIQTEINSKSLKEFLNQMNKYVKIVSGTAFASLVVLVLIFVSGNSNRGENMTKVSGTEQSVFTEDILTIDDFVSDLINSEIDEPMIDDSDIFINLINSNEYEI